MWPSTLSRLDRRWQLLETERRIYDLNIDWNCLSHARKRPNSPCRYLSFVQYAETKGIFLLHSLNVAKWTFFPLHAYQKRSGWWWAWLDKSQSRPSVARITGRPNHTLISDVPVLHWDYTWEEKIPHWGCEGIKWSALEDGAVCVRLRVPVVVCCQMWNKRAGWECAACRSQCGRRYASFFPDVPNSGPTEQFRANHFKLCHLGVSSPTGGFRRCAEVPRVHTAGVGRELYVSAQSFVLGDSSMKSRNPIFTVETVWPLRHYCGCPH